MALLTLSSLTLFNVVAYQNKSKVYISLQKAGSLTKTLQAMPSHIKGDNTYHKVMLAIY
jgi:capsular polysaccharide biosynthesis protein